METPTPELLNEEFQKKKELIKKAAELLQVSETDIDNFLYCNKRITPSLKEAFEHVNRLSACLGHASFVAMKETTREENGRNILSLSKDLRNRVLGLLVQLDNVDKYVGRCT